MVCDDIVMVCNSDKCKTCLHAVGLSLLLTTPLLELHASHVHDGRGDLVHVVLLLLGETEDVEGLLQSHKHYVSITGVSYRVSLKT